MVPSVSLATYIIVLNVDRITHLLSQLRTLNATRLVQGLIKRISHYVTHFQQTLSTPRRRKAANKMELGDVYMNVEVDVKIENAT